MGFLVNAPPAWPYAGEYPQTIPLQMIKRKRKRRVLASEVQEDIVLEGRKSRLKKDRKAEREAEKASDDKQKDTAPEDSEPSKGDGGGWKDKEVDAGIWQVTSKKLGLDKIKGVWRTIFGRRHFFPSDGSEPTPPLRKKIELKSKEYDKKEYDKDLNSLVDLSNENQGDEFSFDEIAKKVGRTDPAEVTNLIRGAVMNGAISPVFVRNGMTKGEFIDENQRLIIGEIRDFGAVTEVSLMNELNISELEVKELLNYHKENGNIEEHDSGGDNGITYVLTEKGKKADSGFSPSVGSPDSRVRTQNFHNNTYFSSDEPRPDEYGWDGGDGEPAEPLAFELPLEPEPEQTDGDGGQPDDGGVEQPTDGGEQPADGEEEKPKKGRGAKKPKEPKPPKEPKAPKAPKPPTPWNETKEAKEMLRRLTSTINRLKKRPFFKFSYTVRALKLMISGLESGSQATFKRGTQMLRKRVG
jgi:hypothetical protein